MRIYDLSQVSILLAEDNDFMARMMTSMLSALRVGRIYRASDGSQAMKIIDEHASGASPCAGFGIDIIMSDWLMEPVDGLQLLRWVRAHPKDQVRFLPFLMITAYPELKRVLTARDCGNTEFLRKPISVRTLVGHLAEVIERPRPFVRTKAYFGPDRRRRELPPGGSERRAGDAAEIATEIAAPGVRAISGTSHP